MGQEGEAFISTRRRENQGAEHPRNQEPESEPTETERDPATTNQTNARPNQGDRAPRGQGEPETNQRHQERPNNQKPPKRRETNGKE